MCSLWIPPSSNSNQLNPSENFFQIWNFLLVFLIYRVKPLIIFCPQRTHSNSNHPNPSENFEMSLRRGGQRLHNYGNFSLKKKWKLEIIIFNCNNLIILTSTQTKYKEKHGFLTGAVPLWILGRFWGQIRYQHAK